MSDDLIQRAREALKDVSPGGQVIAFHFTGDTLRDGRPIPAIGEKLIHTGEIVWCESGLYASPKASLALQYAPGRWLHRVECRQIERKDSDKFVCRERTILQTIDAEHLMRRFAADQALSVSHLWDMPEIVREYLTTLDDALRAAARAAARDAARVAARDAAWAAAWDAAWVAAWDDFDARVGRAFAEAV